jgi:hypothetical protein
VPAAGDVAGSPSCRGVSLSRSRRNCWLFIVVRTAGLGGLGGARVEKFRRAEGLLDSRAAAALRGPTHATIMSPIPNPHSPQTRYVTPGTAHTSSIMHLPIQTPDCPPHVLALLVTAGECS